MAAGDTTLRFSVQVQTDQADAALKAITTSFNQAGVAARQSFVSIGNSAGQAGKALGSFGDQMRAIARDQRSEARAASFYVNEIAQIVPISGAAKSALAGLGQAMIGGAGLVTGIGLAVGLAGALSKHFSDVSDKAKKIAEESQKIADNLAEAVAQGRVLAATTDVGRARLSREAAVGKYMREVDDLQRQIEEKRAELVGPGALFRTEGQQANIRGEISNLRAKMDVAYQEMRNATAKGELDITEAYKKEQEERTKVAADEARKRVEIHKKEMAARLDEARFRAREGAAYGESEVANMLYTGEPTKAPRGEKSDGQAALDARARRYEAAQEQLVRAAREAQRAWESAANAISSSFAQAFTDIIFDANNAVKHIQNLMKSIFAMLLQMGFSGFFGGLFGKPAVPTIPAVPGGAGAPLMRGSSAPVSLTINAVDSRSFVQLAEDNPDAILRPLRAAMANRRF